MVAVKQLETNELEAGLDHIRLAPKNDGRLEMIVRRPGIDQREVIDEARLDLTEGLVGDSWRARGSSSTPDGLASLEAQVTIMNARAAALIAQDRERWPLAGDQLIVDLDLSDGNIPPGTRLAIGSAVVEVSAKLHTGCKKFVARFGLAAMEFVNSPVGRELHLRGINTHVVVPGQIRTGDRVYKM